MGSGGYWRIFARQWLLITVMAALAVAGAAAYSFLVTPKYSSDVRLFVAARSASASAAEVTAAADYAQRRAPTYVDLIDSPAVLTGVIDELGLPYSVNALSRKLTAENPADTVNLVVTVEDADPRRAAAIADTFAPRFAAYVSSLEAAGTTTGTTSPVQLTVTRPATIASSPDSPKTVLNVVLGLFVGLGLGLVAAFVRDQTNSVIIGVRDVERITGSVPLGVVPFDRTTSSHPLVRSSHQAGRAEAFRGLRTNLQFANVDNPPGTIVITSAVPGEGKSTCAANIALTLAVGGATVALVDADMRDPALTTYLGISNAAGLANVLAGQYTLAEVLIRFRTDNLAVLTCGPTPPNPAELLNSTQMENLLGVLGRQFDYVVIDSPPLLRFAEAAVLSAIADGALLVVRNRRTTRDQLERAERSLTTVNARVLGTVLNFAPRQKSERYGHARSATDPRHPDAFFPQGNVEPDILVESPPPALPVLAETPADTPADTPAETPVETPAETGSSGAPA